MVDDRMETNGEAETHADSSDAEVDETGPGDAEETGLGTAETAVPDDMSDPDAALDEGADDDDPAPRRPAQALVMGGIAAAVILAAVLLGVWLSRGTPNGPQGSVAPPPAAGAKSGSTAGSSVPSGSGGSKGSGKPGAQAPGSTARPGATGSNGRAGRSASTTTTTTTPPARMESWVYVAGISNRALAADLASMGAGVTAAVNPTTTTTTTTDPNAPIDSTTTSDPDPGSDLSPDTPYAFTIANACAVLQADLKAANSVPAAPLSTIHQDWAALVAAYNQIEQGCTQAAAGSNPGFAGAWASTAANVNTLTATLVGDLTHAGYCFPADTCPPPFTVP